MATSKTIAGLMGPTLVAVAAALLFNLGSISAVLEPLSRNPALVLIYGIFLFVAGLAIVRFHNRWETNWSVLVTILGWLLVAGGLVRMLFPLRFAAMAGDFAQSSGRMALVAVVLLAVGAFLPFKAERLDALKHYYYALTDMRADLVSVREGLSCTESSELRDDIMAALVLLECAEDKMFSLLPSEEFASPT
jgi:hypothetical protein